jgi:diacylglycerol kinase
VNVKRKWIQSFQYAYEGFIYAFKTQRNMKIHVFIGLAILVLALFFQLPKLETMFILLSLALVMGAELINTAVEKTVDLAMPDRHPLAKAAKDLAAAFVLLTAMLAVGIGLIVFFEPVDRWIRGMNEIEENPSVVGTVLMIIALVCLVIIIVHSFWGKRASFRPDIITGVVFSLTVIITAMETKTAVLIIVYSLCAILVIIRYDKNKIPLAAILFGGLIGIFVTLAALNISRYL